MHHLQKKIVLGLTRKENAHFAELRPKEVDGNIFTYHLKQLIADKLVEKNDDGCYSLTQKGKLAGINIQLSHKDELEQAHSVLFLAVKNKSGEWMLRKRLVHPAFGRVGFLHTEPSAHEDIAKTAKRALKEKANLNGSFEVRGGGYIRLLKKGELESFTHFTLLLAKDVTGNLASPGDSGENFWHQGSLDTTELNLFPNMSKLMDLLTKDDKLFFTEIKHEI
jgi:hypothetical protein